MRLIYIQNGDFRIASESFSQQLPETYSAQQYSVNFVEQQAKTLEYVGVICVSSENEYSNHVLPSGVETFGLKLYHRGKANLYRRWKPRWDKIIDILQSIQPTHLVLRMPLLPIINWGIKYSIPQYVCLADSINPPPGLLRRIKINCWKYFLVKSLNNDNVEWVGNHNVMASLQLAGFGVSPEKIIPWDWPRKYVPTDYDEKSLRDNDKHILIFVGSVRKEKGIGEIIEAYAASNYLKNYTHLLIVGGGNIEQYKSIVANKNLDESIEFLGMKSQPDVLQLMRDSDVVLVPSLTEYSEGLPGTIYEALAVRTPLLISDHPMFLKYFSGNGDVVISPQKSPETMANNLRLLLSDKEQYAALSRNSAVTFQHICHPTMWADPIQLWLDGSDVSKQKLKKLTLTNFL